MNIRLSLFRNGILLFLLGLLTGLIVPLLTNARMGLSAHLEGVLNGMFLILLGLLWPEIRLSAKAATSLHRLVLFGTYANWIVTLLAAVFGTSRLTPIAGAGFSGATWQEVLVGLGQASLALAMIASCVLLLRGLRRLSNSD